VLKFETVECNEPIPYIKYVYIIYIYKHYKWNIDFINTTMLSGSRFTKPKCFNNDAQLELSNLDTYTIGIRIFKFETQI